MIDSDFKQGALSTGISALAFMVTRGSMYLTKKFHEPK
jgi:hypothetical protein